MAFLIIVRHKTKVHKKKGTNCDKSQKSLCFPPLFFASLRLSASSRAFAFRTHPPTPAKKRIIFSHVKCSFIKMRNVYSWKAKKHHFHIFRFRVRLHDSYFSFMCIFAFLLFIRPIECVQWTYTVRGVSQLAGERSERKAKELHDGMKGPICYLMYTFPILTLLVSEKIIKHKRNESGTNRAYTSSVILIIGKNKLLLCFEVLFHF